jgi:zinc protease
VSEYFRALIAAIALLAAGAAAAAAPAWPQSRDLTADRAIRFGILPNGMRYAVMRNATPAGEASLRLRIGAGSLDESEDERGIAHFIEHMVLNGTRHVPEGEFVRRLEREGLKFGPDTNASTDFNQTVYMLDLPQSTAHKLDTALFLLREVADQALFDPAAIDRERGIILSEERSRATPQYHILTDDLAFLMKGDLLPERMPIGSTEIIRTAGHERLAAFYDRNYRPDRATLIAIGDFDPAAVEAAIRAKFGGWRGRAASAAPPPSALQPRAVETHLLVEPGGANRVTLSWVRPPDLRPDGRARRRDQLVDALVLQILRRRLERLSATTSPAPYVGIGVTRSSEKRRADIVQVEAVAPSGRWRQALAAIDGEQRRLVAYGIGQAELDREIAVVRAALTAAAAGAATRASPAIASALVGSVDRGDVFLSAADNLALFEEAVKDLGPARANAAIPRLFAGGGPLVSLTSPVPVEGGETTLRAAYDEARTRPVAAPVVRQAAAWPYRSFGIPGRVTARKEVADLGITEIAFSNGVRLTVRPTAFRKNEVLVAIRYGRGELDLPTGRINPTWGIATFPDGGLGRLTVEDMREALAGTVYSAGSVEDEDAFVLGGRTRPADLERQMQVLAAYVADPGWRQTGLNRLRGLAAATHDQLAATPVGVFRRDSAALLRSGDPRWATPSREQMAAATIGPMREILAPALASGPLEVDIVGDIGVEQAIAETAATFGALPQRAPAPVVEGRRQIRFPAAALETRSHKGRADLGLAFIAWPTADSDSDPRRTRVLNLLAQIVQLRLTDEIREKQGVTYSPIAGHSPSRAFPGYGYLAASIETPPERIDGFFRDALQIARDLGDRPVGADELRRAREPLIEGLERRRADNGYWIDEIAGVQDHPDRLDSLRAAIPQYRSITAADLQQAARLYLADVSAWRMKVVPEARTPSSSSAP